MLIAHITVVLAAADHTAADAGDAADIRHRVGGFGIGQGVHGDLGKINGILLGGGVDLGRIDAQTNNTSVFSGDAAYKMASLDLAAYLAVFDNGGHTVAAHQTAYFVAAGNRSVKSAVAQDAVVAARNAADGVSAAAGGHAAGNRQVPNLRLRGQIPKQALDRTLSANGHTGDPMAVAFQNAAENGNAGKCDAVQVNILFQQDQQVPAVAVQPAVLREFQKIFRCVDAQLRHGDFFSGDLFGGCRFSFAGGGFFLRVDRNRQAEQYRQTQQQT